MGRFQGGVPRFQIGSDGMPFFLTASNVKIPVEVGQAPQALHANPSFEDETAGVPDDWEFIWQTGGATVGTDTTDVLEAERSLTVDVPAGGGNEQIVLSGVFDVSPGDLLEHGVWARQLAGNPTLGLGILTRAASVPAFLDEPATASSETPPAVLAADFSQHRGTFTVPSGHTVARVYYRVGNTAGEAVSARLDLTFSSRTGAALADSGWLPLTYQANWADTGFGWQAGEFKSVGNDVFLRGCCTRSSSPSGANAVIAVLPAEFRPVGNNLVGSCYLNGGGPVADQVHLNEDGEIVTAASVPSGGSVPLQAGPISLL